MAKATLHLLHPAAKLRQGHCILGSPFGQQSWPASWGGMQGVARKEWENPLSCCVVRMRVLRFGTYLLMRCMQSCVIMHVGHIQPPSMTEGNRVGREVPPQ